MNIVFCLLPLKGIFTCVCAHMCVRSKLCARTCLCLCVHACMSRSASRCLCDIMRRRGVESRTLHPGLSKQLMEVQGRSNVSVTDAVLSSEGALAELAHFLRRLDFQAGKFFVRRCF